MAYLTANNLPDLQIAEGVNAGVVTGETMTVLHATIESGAVLPEHSHYHEQILNLIEGELSLTVDSKEFHMTAGDVMILPPNVIHSARALSRCRVIDVFHPVRQEFTGGQFAGYTSES